MHVPVPFKLLNEQSIKNFVPCGPVFGKTPKFVYVASPLSLTEIKMFF
jgi:hypothetical protein